MRGRPLNEGGPRAAHFDPSVAARYAPLILFDEREPFLPIRVGVTILREPGASPSFRRHLEPPPGGLVVEYAIYWDWDIQHLYDLEHLWVFADGSGRVTDAEGSFHGRWLKALLPDRSNIEGDRVRVYSQPGKHAFSPLPIVFRLLPGYEDATRSGAGADGALVGGPLGGRVEKEAWLDEAARRKLAKDAFEPSLSWRPWTMPYDIMLPWEELDRELPSLFRAQVELLKTGGMRCP